MATNSDARSVNELALLIRPIRNGFESAFSWETTIKQAEMLACAGSLPERFSHNVANCLFAIEKARQLSCSPFDIVTYARYDERGNMWFHPAFCISQVNRSRKYKTDIRYEEGGEGDARYCRAYAIRHDGSKAVGPAVTVQLMRKSSMAPEEEQLYDVNPELALRYRAVSYFVRTEAPEVMVSMTLNDEVAIGRDISDVLAGQSSARTPAAPASAFGDMELPSGGPRGVDRAAGRVRGRRRGRMAAPGAPAEAGPSGDAPMAAGAAPVAGLPLRQERLELA